MAHKPKLPRLVVNNEPSDPDDFSYVEFRAAADDILALHNRYPELKQMYKRAFANGDHVMTSALVDLTLEYYEHVDALGEARAAKRRRKLKVVKNNRSHERSK